MSISQVLFVCVLVSLGIVFAVKLSMKEGDGLDVSALTTIVFVLGYWLGRSGA